MDTTLMFMEHEFWMAPVMVCKRFAILMVSMGLAYSKLYILQKCAYPSYDDISFGHLRIALTQGQ